VTPADVLDRALDTGWDGSTPASVRALITLAAEVSEALAAVHLTRRERERIYARSLTLLEEAVNEQRRGWHHALRLQRHAPLRVGAGARSPPAPAGRGLSPDRAALGLFHDRRGPRGSRRADAARARPAALTRPQAHHPDGRGQRRGQAHRPGPRTATREAISEPAAA
jgi:hypothetical protein